MGVAGVGLLIGLAIAATGGRVLQSQLALRYESRVLRSPLRVK